LDLSHLATIPFLVEYEPVEIERDHGEHFSAAFLHELALLLESSMTPPG
jgi:hypothetical protein